MKIDLIITHPTNNDYPLWRDQIREYRHKFNKVIIVFHEANDDVSFKNFVRQVMIEDDITFVETPNIMTHLDWRHYAISNALRKSDAEWVWFTEQDFFIRKGFWKYVERGMRDGADVIATYQETRMHPCNIFVKREVLDQITKDFSAKPPEYDHFGFIQKQLEKLTKRIDIFPENTYRHLNGLSHNFNLIKNGGIPNYEKRAFNMYLNQCLDADVHLNSKWVKIVIDYFDRL